MSDIRYGASPSDWDHLTLILGLQEHLLPVVSRPDAEISPTSALKRLGQIPSLYNHEHKVVGISKWTEHVSSEREIEKWKAEPDYGICIQTRAIRAFDCDITNADLAGAVYGWFLENLPTMLPLRGRSNATKFLLAFRLEGAHAKRVLHLSNGNEGDKIEFLANGQQFIAVGTHPSGVPYQWRGGLPLEIPTLSQNQFEHIWQQLKQHFNATEARDNSKERNAPGGEINDPKLSFLEKAGVITGWSGEGSAYISCPFKSGHSKEGDITETIYFPAGLRDYETGHFKCMHASCSHRTDDDFFEALGYTLSMFDTLPDVEADPAAPSRFTFTDIAEFSSRKPQDYIIKKIMPKADLVVIFGESGAGKSFVAMDMAFSIGRGIEWNSHKTKQGRVAYVVAEGIGGFQKRAQAYAQHHNINLNNVPFSVLADQPNLLDIKDARALSTELKKLDGLVVVFIDTFAQTTPGANENSAEDIGKALKHCRMINKTTGATVVLIHHAGKDLTKGARGWSGLRAAADAEIEISRNENLRNIRISKQKDGEDGAEWGMFLREIPVGVDEDDAIVSSCVVEYTQKQRPKPKEKKLGGLEKIIMDSFDELGGRPIATYELLSSAKDALPKPEGKDNRGFRLRRAIESLVGKGMLFVRDDRVGVPGEDL